MANISILKKGSCNGCALCKNICPYDAIDMLPNDEGFLCPIVNDKCTNCGLCASKCPVLTNKLNTNKSFRAFAVWSKDELREKGSSGGVFPALAEFFVEHDGVVYGAAFEDGCRSLVYAKATNTTELSKLYKSKYVQCDSGLVYRDVKSELESNKTVLFSGCPCQVDALKSYLGKDYSNLLTVDILCHGVPSPYAYNKFLDEISEGKEIASVDFRDKTPGWGTLIRVDFKDGTFHHDLYNGNYFRAFLSGISMRESCYTCPYSQEYRPGDLTIGDFWGVSEFEPTWNDNKGTSIVLVNNAIGNRYLENITCSISKIEEVSYEKVIEICKKYNGALLYPTHPNRMHKCFFKHLKEGDSFSTSLRYAEKSLLDVGILGWWIETPRSNYGSNLTDFALYQYLHTLGLSVAFISPPNFDRNNAGEFNKKYNYRMTMKYPYDKMNENNKYFRTYIVASDTLWYYDAMIQQGWNFLLDFASDEKRKISYATSFGNTVRFFPENEMLYAKYLMHRFDYVSVREFEGVDVCKSKFDVEATQVMDSVFLCDLNDWKMLANNAIRKIEGKFLFSYILDPTQEKSVELQRLANRLGYKLVTITDRQTNTEQKESILQNCGVITNATIEELVYHLLNAEFIVTDSFHGFCFALIFNKAFIALVNRVRGASRFDTLTKIAGCESRMAEHISDTDKMTREELINIDKNRIQTNLKVAISHSKEWLNNALFSEMKKNDMKPEIMLGKEVFDTKRRMDALEERIRIIEEKQKGFI